MPRRKQKQGTGPKSWLLNVLWYWAESLLSASRTITNASFQFGVFLYLGVPNHVASTKPGRGQGYGNGNTLWSLWNFCKVTKKTRDYRNPSGSKMIPGISTRHSQVWIKWLWLEHCHLCALTTPTPLPVSARTHLLPCGFPPPPLLSCYELASPPDQGQGCLRSPCAPRCLTSLLTQCSTKTSHSEEHMGTNRLPAYCNKQSPPPERFIKIVIINSKCLWKWKWGIWQGAEGRRRHLEKDSALLNAIPQPAVGEQISAVG